MIVSLIKLSSLIKKVIFQCIADFVTVPFQPNDISSTLFILLQTVSSLLQILSAPGHEEKIASYPS